MNDILLAILNALLPAAGTAALARLPVVKNWARENWTKAVIIMTVVASYSVMAFGFYTFYFLVRPYLLVCDKANQCVLVDKDEIKQIKNNSKAAVENLDKIYHAANDGIRNYYINEGNRFANVANDIIKKLPDKDPN